MYKDLITKTIKFVTSNWYDHYHEFHATLKKPHQNRFRFYGLMVLNNIANNSYHLVLNVNIRKQLLCYKTLLLLLALYAMTTFFIAFILQIFLFLFFL